MSFYRIAIFLLLFVCVSYAESLFLYVSPDGNDQWSGRAANASEQDGPFATIERAQQEVRRLKSVDSLRGPTTVYLRGGVYYLKQEILFTPEDSGREDAPIRYTNYDDETVFISGGRKLTAWRHVLRRPQADGLAACARQPLGVRSAGGKGRWPAFPAVVRQRRAAIPRAHAERRLSSRQGSHGKAGHAVSRGSV